MHEMCFLSQGVSSCYRYLNLYYVSFPKLYYINFHFIAPNGVLTILLKADHITQLQPRLLGTASELMSSPSLALMRFIFLHSHFHPSFSIVNHCFGSYTSFFPPFFSLWYENTKHHLLARPKQARTKICWKYISSKFSKLSGCSIQTLNISVCKQHIHLSRDISNTTALPIWLY